MKVVIIFFLNLHTYFTNYVNYCIYHDLYDALFMETHILEIVAEFTYLPHFLN